MNGGEEVAVGLLALLSVIFGFVAGLIIAIYAWTKWSPFKSKPETLIEVR